VLSYVCSGTRRPVFSDCLHSGPDSPGRRAPESFCCRHDCRSCNRVKMQVFLCEVPSSATKHNFKRSNTLFYSKIGKRSLKSAFNVFNMTHLHVFADGGFTRGVALAPLVGLLAVIHKMLRDEDKHSSFHLAMVPTSEIRPSSRYFPWKPADVSYPERY
jgi:hypothetical protein